MVTTTQDGLVTLAENVLNEIKTKVEAISGTVITDIKMIWPKIEDLIKSGQLGADIIKLISWVKSVLTIIEPLLPQYSLLFTWITGILTIVSQLVPLI